MIKSAASAASRKPKIKEIKIQGSTRTTGLGAWDDGDGRATGDGRTTEQGTPLELDFLDFGFPGGCASSRLDHGSKFYVIRGGCASSRLISEFSDCEGPWRAETRIFLIHYGRDRNGFKRTYFAPAGRL